MTTILLFVDFFGLAALAWWVYRRQPVTLQKFYWPALVLKLTAGFGVGILYFYHYGYGDTIKFWQDSVIVSRSLWLNPIETLDILWNEDSIQDGPLPGLSYRIDRSFFFVKILGIVAFFFGNNYWMMASALSFISFLAAWFLIRRIVECFPDATIPSVIAFLFFPTVVFWSAGVIKESVGLAALYVVAARCLRWVYQHKARFVDVPAIVLAVWVGWSLKYYWIVIFVAAAIPFVIVSLCAQKVNMIHRYRLPIWLALTLVMILASMNAHPNFDPGRLFLVIDENNEALMRLSTEENAVRYNLTPDFRSLMMNSPKALVTGLFRPFLWETFNTLSFFSALANTFVLIASILALPSLKKLFTSEDNLLAISIFFYVTLLAIFLALSTPNFGTLDRLKIGYTPFFLCLVLYHNPLVKRFFSRHSGLNN